MKIVFYGKVQGAGNSQCSGSYFKNLLAARRLDRGISRNSHIELTSTHADRPSCIQYTIYKIITVCNQRATETIIDAAIARC